MKKNPQKTKNLTFSVVKDSKMLFSTESLKFLAFCGFFFVFLLIPTLKISASTIFTDNFESYNLGNLDGQGNWEQVAGTATHFCQVQNSYTYEGEKAGYCYSAEPFYPVYKIGSQIDSGNFSLKFLILDPTTTIADTIMIWRAYEGATSSSWGVKIEWNDATKQFEFYYLNTAQSWEFYISPISTSTWHSLYVEWDNNLESFRVKLNDNFWSSWQKTLYPFDFVNEFRFSGTAYLPFYFDLIGESDIGLSPIFSPSYPVECSFATTTSPIAFNATGTITIPILNAFHWFEFSVIAQDFNTSEKYYFSTSTDLDAGDVYNYSIPISLPDGAWKISYLLQGIFFETTFFASHWCEHTGIGTALPLPTWKEITEIEFLGLEECSGYPLLERLVCELKNAIKKIFVPSPQSITDLKNTIDGLKNKAPMNYISATKNFFDEIKTGINPNQDLAFKILGKTGNVSFAFWEATTTIAGQNQSFKDIFKAFFIFIIVLGFLFWAISYIRKIFR